MPGKFFLNVDLNPAAAAVQVLVPQGRQKPFIAFLSAANSEVFEDGSSWLASAPFFSLSRLYLSLFPPRSLTVTVAPIWTFSNYARYLLKSGFENKIHYLANIVPYYSSIIPCDSQMTVFFYTGARMMCNNLSSVRDLLLP